MNYYIDFDSTLYNTPLLRKQLLNSITSSITIQRSTIDSVKLFGELDKMFNRQNIYDVFDLAKVFAKKHSVDLDVINQDLNLLLSDTSELLFDDSIDFLKKIKKVSENKLHILSFSAGNIRFQTAKIAGSGLAELFDTIIITATPKYKLDIDYTSGVFVDDNPEDLLGLYKQKPTKIIRIRRKENEKYSSKDLNLPEIAEYPNLKSIPSSFFHITSKKHNSSDCTR